ncbi:MAG: serine/threonine protein kinase [Gemmatimonadetes bacterium]|nr:serine/threonine protein kinase [Gemmatimonadota bacterium]
MTEDLTPAEWAELKALWSRVEELPAQARAAAVAEAPVGDAVRRTMADLLADLPAADAPMAAVGPLDRPAFELLGLGATTAANGLAAATGSSDNAPDVDLPLIGRRLGPFRVVRLVGRGGMGAVYEAERADDAYRQRVAIKTLWRGADSGVLLQRFRSERQILAGLQHPHIAQLVDGGSTTEGTPWLAMEFVEGTPIDAWCDARALRLPARLDLFRQICAAVQHAHQRLVVHRDLKPSNILVTDDGVVKLLDFGVAKLIAPTRDDSTLTDAGLSPFTAAYAAPEQATDDAVSTATDVYALGAVLTVLLAGAPPREVQGLTPSERWIAVRDGIVRKPSDIARRAATEVARARGFATPDRVASALAGELDAIVAKALSREPARRYASVEALSDDVRRYLRRERVLARPDSLSYRLLSLARRRPALTAVVVTGVVAVTTAAGVAWQQAVNARAEAHRAERATTFLSGLLTGVNATSYEPTVRLSPSGTFAELLDSALVRVPREFADDARIRARLYLAIGANLATQRRHDHAVDVLDSAQLLAAEGYGRSSPEHARALLEWGAARLEQAGPRAIDSLLTTAARIAATSDAEPELGDRLALLRAAQAMQDGRVREADSLAAQVLVAENARGRRGMLALRAEALRMYASSWTRRDPRDYLARAQAVLALGDSIGVSGTSEQMSALGAQFEALAVLARTEAATAALETWRNTSERMAGTDPIHQAELARQRSYLASVAGDTARRRSEAQAAFDGLRAGLPLSLSDQLLILRSYLDDALARGDTSAAREGAHVGLARLRPSGSPMLLGFGYQGLARAELASRNPDAAIAAAREGARWVRGTDLESLLPLLRRVEVQALDAAGRTRDADSVRALLPKPGSLPRCTPGGDWRGC